MPNTNDQAINLAHDEMLRLTHSRQLRADLSEAEKAEALRIGRIEFASAGAVRKR